GRDAPRSGVRAAAADVAGRGRGGRPGGRGHEAALLLPLRGRARRRARRRHRQFRQQAEERRHGRVGAGQQCPGGQGAAGPEAQEQWHRARHRHQEVVTQVDRCRCGGGGGGGSSATVATGVQREVYSKKGVMRRLMRWSRLRWEAAEQAECAVCLDEFAAGDVLAHLPCGHRFHWGCALPWLEGAAAASHSCPFCRAAVDAGAGSHAAS
uniref:RING-type domain-containing protein n=1 Tax=Aegilops tauschii subsp. strangulata TaxID=200361 RepID=A0A453QXW5_AEGTS